MRWREGWGLATIVAFAACTGGEAPTRAASDPALRGQPIFLYAAADSTRPPRAIVFFFGNDIGFWEAHRELATSLAKAQFAVAGFDMRPLLHSLPERGAARDSAFVAAITPLIAGARRELGGDSVPLIIAGHSLGAEVAIWTAAYACPDGVVAVLAMSPGSRSHLRVEWSDLLNGPEPTGDGSFSVAAAIAAVPADERVAIIRGSRDDYAHVDSALLAAGGSRAKRYMVPFAGHSMKQLLTASYETRRALDWLLADVRPVPR